jgi:hypothetical protein
MGYLGLPRATLAVLRRPWASVGVLGLGLPWATMGVLGLPLATLGYLWLHWATLGYRNTYNGCPINIVPLPKHLYWV